jgi:MFS family permease
MTPSETRILVACTVGNAVSFTPAIHSVFGLFLGPLSATFGWTRASISGVLGLIALIAALTLPFLGRYADRHGARSLVLAGCLLFAGAIASLSLTNGSLSRFYLTFTVVALVGCAASPPILSKVIAQWFDRNRGSMLGISGGLGGGVGSTVIPIAAALMMPAFGWRGTYVGVGAIIALVGFPILFVWLKDAPQLRVVEAVTAGEGLSLPEAIRTKTFWLLIVALASGAGCLTSIFSHIVPILAERGVSIPVATSVISVFAMVAAGWQIAFGVILDRVPSSKITAPMYLTAAGGLLVLEYGVGTPALVLAGIALGIGLGSQFGALPFLVARYFGLRHFGVTIGVMYSAVFLLQGATPVVLDHVFDVQQSYRLGVIGIAICLATGAALLLLLPSYSTRGALEELQPANAVR